MIFSTEEWGLAFDACLHSCAAYHDQETVRGILSIKDGAGEPVFCDDKGTDVQAYGVRVKGVTWISIRGSESRADWGRNFKFFRRRGIHRGFREGAKAILETVFDMCNRHKDEPVIVTGHSAGGAIACIVALWLRLRGFDVRVYTFGAPRVFSWYMAFRFNRYVPMAWRWVNDRDGVPRLPPRILGYSHAGLLRFSDHRGVVTDVVSDTIKARVRGGWMAVTFRGIEAASDHDADRYYAMFSQNIPVDGVCGSDRDHNYSGS